MMKDNSPMPNIVVLLNRRQLGLPRNEKGRSVRHSLNNYRCDFQLLKCLLSVGDSYLEVIAGKQIHRSNAPSFCHNRLFTNNYRTWFNLCTSPTSGPTLIKHDIFHPQSRPGSVLAPRPRILDGITVDPPSRCMPLPNSQSLPCIVLLSKDGWLYQYSLEDATCLNKIFLRTRFFSDNSSRSNSEINGEEMKQTGHIKDQISSLVFNYQYIEIFNVEGHRVLISSSYNTTGLNFKAYVIIGLFPLRIINHFVTVSTTRSLNIQLWGDLMILTIKTGSLLSLYGLQDILARFCINSEDVCLDQPLTYNSPGGVVRGHVGDTVIGLPYMSNPVILDEHHDWSKQQLFKTKAIKHIFRIGGIPFHFAVPMDLNCTTWSLRKLSDGTEISRFRVDNFSEEGCISGLDFHSDDSGRLLISNKETVTMYQISERYRIQEYASSGLSTFSRINVNPSKSVSPMSQTGFLRLVGSPLVSRHESMKLQSVVRKCFEIRLDKQREEMATSDFQDVGNGGLRPRTRSSYGRVLRNPERLAYSPIAKPEVKVLSLSYENELDIIAILHLKGYSAKPALSFSETFYDVIVSLYENQSGAKINSAVVERSLTINDFTNVIFSMDGDTVMYARTELTNLVNYKVLRFCRRY